MEIPKIASLYIGSGLLPKLNKGMRKIKEGAYRIESPGDSIIHTTTNLPDDYQNPHYVYKGYFIRKYDSGSDIKYLIVKPTYSDYLYYLYFREYFHSIEFEVTPISSRKSLVHILPGNFLVALKLGANGLFKIKNQKFVLNATKDELKILYYGKNETVSVF